MSEREKAPISGVEFYVVGLIVCAVGGLLWLLSDFNVWVALAGSLVGLPLLGVGVVATGVTVGLRRADYLRRRP